jgi:hypothetical protein
MGQNPGGQRNGSAQSGRTAQNQTQSGQQNRQPQPNQQTSQGTQSGQPANGQTNANTAANGATAQNARQPSLGEEIAGWFTETIVRAVVAVFGIALLLLAIGQIFGANVLGAVAEFMTSGIGGWLLVGFLALMLIVAAGKNWRASRH